MLNVQINKDLVLENDGDFGEDASMAPVCQIAMETPIPLQLFNCLPYIFLLKTFFFLTKCSMLLFWILGVLALFGKPKIGEGREQ